MTRKSLGALALALTLIGMAPQQGRAEELQKIVTCLGPDAFYYMLHYVADGAGLFKAEGLDVDLVTVNSGSRQVATVTGGSAEIAEVNLSVAIQAQLQGAEMLINIGQVYETFPHVLFLSNESIKKTGITAATPFEDKVARLKGLKIGITSPGSGTDQLMRILFLGRGKVPDQEVALQPLGGGPPMLAALQKHVIDGFVFTAPLPQAASSQGLGEVVISPFNGEVPELRDVPYMSMVTNRDTLEHKKPQLKKLSLALTKALKFIHDKPVEARTITRKWFKDMDEKVFNASFDEHVKGLPKSLEISPAQLEKTFAFMSMLDQKPETAKYTDIIYPDLAKQAAAEVLGQ